MHTAFVVVAALAAAAHMPAFADVLDFNTRTTALTTSDEQGLGPLQAVGSSGWVSQSYGDIPGVLNVAYSSVRFDNLGSQQTSLRTYASGYDELAHVAAGNPSFAAGFSRNSVFLIPQQPGVFIRLNSFRLGAVSGPTGQYQNVSISDRPGGSFFSSGPYQIGVGDQSTLFEVNRFSLTGFEISWSNGLGLDSTPWVGIDNIDFTVQVVPEPTTVGMMALGLAAVGAAARRRKR